MADYGLKVSKEGIGVGTASNKDLIFNSELACLKVVQAGSISFNIDNGGTSVGTISLDYPLPLHVTVWGYVPSLNSFTIANVRSGFVTNGLYYDMEFDNANLYVHCDNYTGGSVSGYALYFISYA